MWYPILTSKYYWSFKMGSGVLERAVSNRKIATDCPWCRVFFLTIWESAQRGVSRLKIALLKSIDSQFSKIGTAGCAFLHVQRKNHLMFNGTFRNYPNWKCLLQNAVKWWIVTSKKWYSRTAPQLGINWWR